MLALKSRLRRQVHLRLERWLWTPSEVCMAPSAIAERVAEQTAAGMYARSKRTPRSAIESMFGVGTAEADRSVRCSPLPCAPVGSLLDDLGVQFGQLALHLGEDLGVLGGDVPVLADVAT